MKIISVLMLVFLLTVSVASADYLVCDPNPSAIGANFEIWQAAKGLTDNQVVTTGKMIVDQPAEADGSIKYNMDSVATGSFNWYLRYYRKAYTYGPTNTQGGSTVYSVPFTPFDFTKYGIATGPITGIKVVTP